MPRAVGVGYDTALGRRVGGGAEVEVEESRVARDGSREEVDRQARGVDRMSHSSAGTPVGYKSRGLKALRAGVLQLRLNILDGRKARAYLAVGWDPLLNDVTFPISWSAVRPLVPLLLRFTFKSQTLNM